jgi:hypothetical protein
MVMVDQFSQFTGAFQQLFPLANPDRLQRRISGDRLGP